MTIEAIEKRRINLLDKVFHELKSPITGIEGHTDVLINMYHKCTRRDIEAKLKEIEFDCEILRHNIAEMRYF